MAGSRSGVPDRTVVATSSRAVGAKLRRNRTKLSVSGSDHCKLSSTRSKVAPGRQQGARDGLEEPVPLPDVLGRCPGTSLWLRR